MARPNETVSGQLRSMGRGRDERTPMRLLALVSLVIAAAVSLVTLAVLLVYYRG